MRNFIHLLLCLAFSGFILLPNIAQSQIICGTNQSDSLLRVQYPGLPGLEEFELEMANKVGKNKVQTKRNSEGIIRIPVVVHVIHNGEALGTGRNISDAQVLSQIRVMNEDFRRKPGTRGYNTFPNGADSRIEFEMAKRTPTGEPSNGIVRYNATALNWGTGTISPTNINNIIKPATIWDPNQFLNMWAINLGNGFFGYAQFPFFSGLLGFDCFGVGTAATGIGNTDGVVMNHNCFGSDDDGTFPILDANHRKGKVTIHELGHYFGLRHIWGDGNCGSDFCEDTPTHDSPTSGCPSTQQTNNCNGTTNIELFQDYMDYSNDLCQNVFTKDQAIRMRTVLENSPRRKQLTYSPGSMVPQQKDASLSAVNMVFKDQCAGVQPMLSVSVINTGLDPLTSVQLKYQLNGGAAQTSDKTLNLTYMEQSEFQVTIAGAAAAGNNLLTLWVEQSNGAADFASRLDTFVVEFESTSGIQTPFAQDFENEVFPAPLWTIRNPDADCFEWRQQSVPQGRNGGITRAYFLKLSDQTFIRGQRDQLVTPLIQVQGLTNPALKFDLAFANPQSLPTKLRVYLSTNCGQTWQPNPIYEKAGATLRTTTISATDFIPNNQNQWRTDEVNLANVSGQTIRLMFEVESWGGNNFYIDNIAVNEAAPLLPQITAFSPGSGAPATSVQISGIHFIAGTQAFFNGTPAATTIVSQTELTAVVPAAASTGFVSVSNTNGSAVSDSIFIVNRIPTILYFSPLSGQVGASVSVYGRDFMGVTEVSFNGTIANFTIVSPTEISTTVPIGATTGLIRVTNPSGTAQSATAFIVGEVYIMNNSTITSCSGTFLDPGGNGNYPSNLDVIQTIRPATPDSRISVRFTNFSTVGQYDYMIAYNGPTIFSPQIGTYVGNISTFNIISSHPTGALTFQFISNISAESSGFEATISCLNNVPPIIMAFSPDTGLRGSRVLIQGENFTPQSVVRFNGIASTSIEFLGTDEIAAIVPTTARTGFITLTTAYGSDTSNTVFVVDTTQVIPGYCNVLQSACGTAFIQNVRIIGSSFNNSSTCTNNLNRAYSRYLPGAGTTANLLQFKTYTVQVTLSSANVTAVGIWLDLNTNGTFEANEYFAQNSGGSQIRTINISLPQNMQFGLTGMRVRCRNGSMLATDACINFTSGETEDYFVRLQPNPAPIIETFTPNFGLAGTSVAITGLNFNNVLAASFNGTNASFTINSPTSITAIVPAGATTGKIALTNAFGSDTSFSTFYVSSVKPFLVMLLHSETNESAPEDVVDKLKTFGVIDQIDKFNGNLGTPTLAQLNLYDAVFVWTSATWQNRVTLGNNLSTYLETGGNVVKGIYATAGTGTSNPGGTFLNYDLIPFGTAITTSSSGLGNIFIPNHPIIQGVNAFQGGTQSIRPNTLNVSAGADRIANWLDNRPLIVARQGFPTNTNTRKVDLGFYPPSSKLSGNNWNETTDGARIMLNALLWAGRRDSLIYLIPEFTDFAPRSGDEGLVVTLRGKFFNTMNRVLFNGLEASFTLVNDSTITTTVPVGATTGFIQVRSTTGATFQSPGVFLVGNELRMTNGSFTFCNGRFLSSEYVNTSTPGYLDNEQYVLTVNPTDPSAKVKIDFSFFNTESGYDFLFIYNGPNTTSPLVGQYSGANLPPSFTSTHPSGALTFRFVSDASVINIGWDAQLTCFFPTPTIIALTPSIGQIGSPVTISGTNLSNTSSVRFNGVEATIISGSAAEILTSVPAGATTGLVQVVTPQGTATSSQIFSICNEFSTTPQSLDTVYRCGPGQVTLSATGATGNNSYRWFATENSTTAIGNEATLNQTVAGARSYFVAFHNQTSGCTGPRRQIRVALQTTPNAGFSGLNSQYCQGDSSQTLIPVINGGVFSSNVINNRFYALQTGSQTVRYTVVSGICTNEVAVPVLVLTSPEASFSTNGSLLTANIVPGATYQWLLNGSLIGGANTATYTAISGGLYRLVVRLGICTDTSEATLISKTMAKVDPESISVYPNPFESGFYVDGISKEDVLKVTLTNQIGQHLPIAFSGTEGTLQLSVNEIPDGIYILTINTKTSILRKKIEKRR